MLDHEETDRHVERIALELRRPVDLGHEVDRAVMAAIKAAPLMVTSGASHGDARRAPAARRSVWRSVTRARTVQLRVSPLAGIAAAVLAVAAIFGLRREQRMQTAMNETGEYKAPTGEYPVSRDVRPTSNVAAAAKTDTVYVTRFMLVAPDARNVSLVGDFNDWEHGRNPLQRQNGVWTVTVPLRPGRYNYAFLVDGERWTTDPAAPRDVGDDFGRPSSVITVREI